MSGVLAAVMALAVVVVPGPEEVGSVEGPFAWGDVQAGLGVIEPPKLTEGLVLANQGPWVFYDGQLQGFAGYGLPILGHHLAISASLYGTLVPRAVSPTGATLLQPSPLRLGASLPLGLGAVALVPKVDLGVPVGLVAPGRYVTLTPAFALRWRVADVLLLGADAAFTFNLLEPKTGRDGPTHYDRDSTFLSSWLGSIERWRAQGRLQAEYELAPTVSLAARLEFVARDFAPVSFLSSFAPDASIIELPHRYHELGATVEVHWAFTDHFGLTASAAISGQSIIDLKARYLDATYTRAEGHVTLWFRTDARLRRAWLER